MPIGKTPSPYGIAQPYEQSLIKPATGPETFPTAGGGGGGGGGVASVTGTSPIASSGGTTPDISLNASTVVAGTYGDSGNVGQFTVDAHGLLTFAQNVQIAGGMSAGNLWQYRANTGATSGYPNDGHMLWDNATQTSATHLLFAHITNDNLDIDLFLGTVASGNTLWVQDANNSDNFQKWTVSGTPTNTNGGTATSYWTMPVTLVSSGGTGTTGFPNNHQLAVFRFSPGGTGTVTSVDITSTAGTISPTLGPITTSGSINVEITGIPTGDNTVNLGSTSRRWATLYFPTGGDVRWYTGTHTNSMGYTDAIGPYFFDATATHKLINNIQALTTSDRTATWPDISGVVAVATPIDGNILIGNSIRWVSTTMGNDATIATGGSLTLATVNSNVGTWGDATHVGQFTVNAKGLITSAASVAITGFMSSTLTNTHIFVGNVSNVATDVALSGDATLANTGAMTLATVNSNVGAFTNANITVNAKGLITAAANGTSGGTLTTQQDGTNVSTTATTLNIRGPSVISGASSTATYTDMSPSLNSLGCGMI